MEHVVNALGDALTPWGYILVFVITALEASAFVGLAVPGETALLLAGYLAYQGRMSLPLVIVLAVAGAVVGDSVGYEIGRHLGERLKRTALGRRVGEERWDRARAFIRRQGGKAILLGRFIGVLRALVPAAAGDARVPYRAFLAWNVAGAVVWAPGVVLLGYVAGSSYETVDKYLGRGTLALLAILVVALVAAHLWRSHRKGVEPRHSTKR